MFECMYHMSVYACIAREYVCINVVQRKSEVNPDRGSQTVDDLYGLRSNRTADR